MWPNRTNLKKKQLARTNRPNKKCLALFICTSLSLLSVCECTSSNREWRQRWLMWDKTPLTELSTHHLNCDKSIQPVLKRTWKESKTWYLIHDIDTILHPYSQCCNNFFSLDWRWVRWQQTEKELDPHFQTNASISCVFVSTAETGCLNLLFHAGHWNGSLSSCRHFIRLFYNQFVYHWL